jgi:hypothetical protein
MRLVFARKTQMLELTRAQAAALDARRLERRRIEVKRLRRSQPAARAVELEGLRHFAADVFRTSTIRHGGAGDHLGHQRFIDRHLSRQRNAQSRRRDRLVWQLELDRMPARGHEGSDRNADQHQTGRQAHARGRPLRAAPIARHQQHRHARAQQQAAGDHRKQQPQGAVCGCAPQPDESRQ